MDGLIKVTPDFARAQSMVRMVITTLAMIEQIDPVRFSSNVTKEYYEALRELLSVMILLDGFKTYGEGAHKRLIEYIRQHYSQLTAYDIELINELRNVRNKIAYDGFFVGSDYILRKQPDILKIIAKLQGIINIKLSHVS